MLSPRSISLPLKEKTCLQTAEQRNSLRQMSAEGQSALRSLSEALPSPEQWPQVTQSTPQTSRLAPFQHLRYSEALSCVMGVEEARSSWQERPPGQKCYYSLFIDGEAEVWRSHS